jgi:hypothetical protein
VATKLFAQIKDHVNRGLYFDRLTLPSSLVLFLEKKLQSELENTRRIRRCDLSIRS